jgi:hypothetical protein
MLRLPVADVAYPCVSSSLVTKRFTEFASRPDLFRLLFIVALLVSQFSLLKHQLDFQHHADGKECTICLASPGLEHALSATVLPPPGQAVFEAPFVATENCVASRTPVRLVARAPPVSLQLA